ncbi:hypothetical protein WS58_24070 [Burkholderia pseudomultivorans]|nr:hypothetical protein WS56_00815 [Burkholderia pseudomultivorans]KVC30256.1 hypothetical protein WS55_08185 [Burkholderia pseudomultivorans]KVC37808.1 hypothetical protein WS58_24070 [Burkholderia pseudomultivorans]
MQRRRGAAHAASGARSAARVEWADAAARGRRTRHDAMMKTLFCLLAAALVCAACAQGGTGAAGERGGSLEMYGTIDQGITVRR